MTKIEKQKYKRLADYLKKNPTLIDDDYNKPRTIVMVTSFSLDPEELRKVFGIEFYEERLLYFIGLLKNSNTKLIFVSSVEINPDIIDYYLDIYSEDKQQRQDMKKRLIMKVAGDSGSYLSLTQKILKKKKIIAEIKKQIPNKKQAVLRCFNSTEDEEKLAVQLGIPLYAPMAKFVPYGSKSGCRKVFIDSGVEVPPGHEDIKNFDELLKAICQMKKKDKKLEKVVLKFNYSFSGGGNAILNVKKLPSKKEDAYNYMLRYLRPVEEDLSNKKYLEKYFQHGGIVEEWMMQENTGSPSVQLAIKPNKEVEITSTHEQLLAEDRQTFLGCRYPARKKSLIAIKESSLKIGRHLAKKGIIGRFAIDFIVQKKKDKYTDPRAIEINLRKGGTTHPYFMTKLVTGAIPDQDGLLRIDGRKVFYYAFDTIKHQEYKNLTPKTLIEVVRDYGLEYDPETQTGVILHLLGALQPLGKFGAVCIARSPKAAEQIYFLLVRIVKKYLEEKQGISIKQKDSLVNKERLVATFCKIVKIDSPTGEEKLLSLAIRDKFESLKYKVYQDEANNLLVQIPGRGTTPFLLSAHMDVVRPCNGTQPVVRGNKIMSDGKTVLGADDKAAIAYILELIYILRENKIPHKPLELLFTVGEENLFTGIQAFDCSKIVSPKGYILDGADIGEIDVAAPYMCKMIVKIKGRAAHSGVNPEDG
ncbi:MAG: peptide ligase PGM1-related protein, partial [Patescibacteria group bacterium]